jgi:hypothetical protein
LKGTAAASGTAGARWHPPARVGSEGRRSQPECCPPVAVRGGRRHADESESQGSALPAHMEPRSALGSPGRHVDCCVLFQLGRARSAFLGKKSAPAPSGGPQRSAGQWPRPPPSPKFQKSKPESPWSPPKKTDDATAGLLQPKLAVPDSQLDSGMARPWRSCNSDASAVGCH